MPHTFPSRPAVIGGERCVVEDTLLDGLGVDCSDAGPDAGSATDPWGRRSFSKEGRDAVLANAPPLTNVKGWNLIVKERYMLKLAANGPVEVVPYDVTKPVYSGFGGRKPGNLPSGLEWDSRTLAPAFFVPPYGKVYTSFYTVDLTFYQGAPLPSNKHIPGCDGDAYIVGHFEPSQDGQAWHADMVSADDFDEDEAMPEWLGWSLDMCHGLLPSKPEHWETMAHELRFKSLFYYNDFRKYVSNFETQLLYAVKEKAPSQYSNFQRSMIKFIKTFKHPESELVQTSGSFMHPDGLPVQLVRTTGAVKAYTDETVEIVNKHLRLGGAAVKMCAYEIPDGLANFKVDCPGMAIEAYGRQIGAVWSALVSRARERASETEAARARRLEIHDAMVEAQQAEAKAKELRRKLQAAESRKAAEAAAPKPFTAYREPPTSKKAARVAARKDKRMGTKEQATANVLAHEVHVIPEQRELRHEAAELRKQVAHAERLEREAREKVTRLRQLAAEVSAAHEAAVHVVPPQGTLNGALISAIKQLELA